MTTITLSSREFNQDISRAKREADHGPVIITDRGRPAYVLLSHEEYHRLIGTTQTIRELLYQPGIETIEFEPLKLGNSVFKAEDFS